MIIEHADWISQDGCEIVLFFTARASGALLLMLLRVLAAYSLPALTVTAPAPAAAASAPLSPLREQV